MTYAVAFALMALGSFVAVATYDGALAVLFALIGVAALIVAIAYATRSPRLLGKRGDGSRAAWAWPLLWPYLLLAGASLALYRHARRRDDAIAEASPGLWFARRPMRAELARTGVATWAGVLDLAAEFPRVGAAATSYRSLPLLDGLPLDAGTIADAVAWLDAHATRGPVLVHCALGHGRTGSIVAAWLVAHRQLPDVDAAVAHLRRLRPGFGMSVAQRAAVDRFLAGR